MPENYLPQRIVSLQPSISVTLRDLGLLHRLVACTKYCLDVCPELSQQKCLVVEDSWSADGEQIKTARPDLVFASVPYQIEALAEIMKAGIPFVGFAPKSLSDVFTDIAAIARITGAETKGFEIIDRMRSAILAVQEKAVNLETPLVYCEEWGKPLIASQKWVAELVEAAAGRFYGEPGKQVSADQVQAADPDVIITAWCGAGDRVPLEKIVVQRGWEKLKAVQQRRVYCINDEFLNTPASTLIDGLHAIASAIQPDMFAKAPGLRRMNAINSL
ncbi:MAG TPA: ABC transporter substrate-binding protein [Candidatus Angelobacter sp.]|jgi:iron complex transport system substrate-binding protein|nr:ABC transporter substrate-binding protein [Candidatus Angelobacter sp.]